MTGRYATHGSEVEDEPGSRGRVLANRLRIVRVRDMQTAETGALLQLTYDLLSEITETQRFTADDLCEWHERWLGGIYDWAGRYRQVNMSKDGFPFAAARLVPRLMADYSNTMLAQQTPCAGMDGPTLVRALARTHAEYILIHPFREGNGRLVRLFPDMAMPVWQIYLYRPYLSVTSARVRLVFDLLTAILQRRYGQAA